MTGRATSNRVRFKRFRKDTLQPRAKGYIRWGVRRYHPGWTIFAGPFVIFRDKGPLNVWWNP